MGLLGLYNILLENVTSYTPCINFATGGHQSLKRYRRYIKTGRQFNYDVDYSLSYEILYVSTTHATLVVSNSIFVGLCVCIRMSPQTLPGCLLEDYMFFLI